jgi:dTDP-4-dehydrorhamnose reductase
MNDRERLQTLFDDLQPTEVIHAAGMCDLDVCELWPGLAYARNVEGTRNIVALSQRCSSFLYISTDLVFSGQNPPPAGYSVTCPADPISMIGKTFLQAEAIVAQLPQALMVRKGLPIGPSLSGRKGALDYLAHRFRQGKPLTLFYDELRSAIASDDFTHGVLRLWAMGATGLYHFGGPRKVSLYAIGQYVIETYHYEASCLIRASRHDDQSGLPRIGDVALNSQRTYDVLGFTPRPWPA